jgi:hypothetical protein
VQRHHVRGRQQLVEAGAALGVAQGQLVRGVVEGHVHAQVLREHGQLGADVAVADDAEPAAAHLVAADGGLVPDALVHEGVLLGQPAGHRDDLGEGQLDHRAGVGEGRVEDGDAGLRRGGEVDLIGADAERADRDEAVRGLKDLRGDLRLGPDAEQLHTLDALDQLDLVEGVADGLDLVTRCLEPGNRVRVNAFEQQDSHLGLVGHHFPFMSG